MVALFGRYEYERELGRGATGRVFAVRDLAEGGAARAIKVVGSAHAPLLVWEFQRLCRLEHPRIARVRELLRIDAPVHAPFRLAAPALLLVEDLAAGLPLSALTPPDDLTARQAFALRAALSAAEGLRAIHRAGLVHGDVKPDNLLVVEESAEATLIDLGFCAPPGMREEVRGTPRYMAPELFSGMGSAAADVYALGASLFDWVSGDVEGHSSSRSGDLLPTRNLATLRTFVKPAFADLIAALLEPDPARRPSDADALYRLLVPVAQAFSVLSRKDPALLSDGPSGDAEMARARTLPFVGHSDLIERVELALKADGNVLVLGARGAGRSRLVREAVRRLALSAIEAGRAVPTLVRSVESLAAISDVPSVLWLAPPPHAAEREWASALRVKALRSAGLSIVLECEPSFSHEGATRVELGPLGSDAFQALLRRLVEPRAVTPALALAASQASQNYAGRLCNVVAEACAEQRDLGDPRSLRTSAELDTGSLSPWAFALASLAAWTGGALSDAVLVHAPLAERERELAFAELWGCGLLMRGSAELELVPSVASVLRARSYETRGQILAALPATLALDDAFARFARGQVGEAEQAFHAQAAKLRNAGEVARACILLREAVALMPSDALRVSWADAERAQAHYQEALSVLVAAHVPQARLLEAEVRRLRGEREDAAQIVAGLTAHALPSVREPAQALEARILFDAGDLTQASEMAQAVRKAASAEARVRGLEVLLLVALATGLPDGDQADALVQAATNLEGPRRFLARALLLRAQLSARRGEPASAMADALRALEHAEQAGEGHEAASAALNLGLLQAEAGELGLAQTTLSAAAFRLARIDRPSDLSRVLFNLSALALLVGDSARAAALLDAAEEPARKAADPAVRAFLAMTRAELWLKSGLLERAGSLLAQALAQLPEGLRPIRAVLSARAAQTALVSGELPRAHTLVQEARACCDAGDVSVELEVVVAEIRERLSSGYPVQAEELALRAMPLMAGRAPFAERLRFLLAAIDAARAAEREAEGRERMLLCRAMLEAALGSLPASGRGKLRERPEYARILAAPLSETMRSAARGEGRWRKLVASTRRLFASTQRRELAEQVVEIALELVHAERAFLVACLEDGSLALRAKAELGASGSQDPVFSRSVVERVWSERRPLLTLEASRDLRLHGAQSIHALSVRSVLAVPLSGFGEAAVLYLDDRLRADAFDSDDLALLEDLAAVAREALRVAHARQLENRRARKAEQEASALTRVLLASESGEGKASAMIGVSPVLQKVTATARRIAHSEVSLLITGESGTGKELLARFVHQESGRRAQPFVAESCAALPDTLLESALFGHVRGAFTGADRARRGLFETADNGSLFLDEVGEMSPALQAKLLRVLQEGEFRPLGSERTRKVDVRVIAATRADLAARVREGSFREDLYYRLAVVTLELPPLSARRDDIALLVRHFLGKHQGSARNVTISAAALRAFAERDYPGNVRQLENEVRRALALCEGARIEASDVPSDARKAERAEGPQALDLHAQLEALSFRLVDDALARSSGNVTQAAELLGISRFGLQKMLKRRKGN